ncbi:hypothetical protein CTEN210_04069 [Chaetoceros tenuissimus]|uniref:Uncharacterized protein n=1 Tax=Chaetoceros tenuissimus TaxID=426638 RepID=A0AAD3CMW6_9STRA|nr:hypothetical protein CTEN210_04069 [Chaetoceros tenuissimus]
MSHSTNASLRGGEEKPSASISDLPNDLLKHCFSFIPGSYVTVAPVSRQFFSNYSTMDMDDSAIMLSAGSLLKIGRNKRTTADAVSNDVKLTEYCFIKNAPKEFMIEVCQSAALKGHKDILECANIFGIEFAEMIGEGIYLMEKLAKEGNLEMIQYFDDKDFGDFEEEEWFDIYARAQSSDHLHIMKWLFQERFRFSKSSSYMQSTIQAYEHVLEGVEAPRVTDTLCRKAAQNGNIEVLEYCHRNNFQFESDVGVASMLNKDKEQALATLKWLRRHGCPWEEDLCRAASSNDNLEALKWARNEGCPWDEDVIMDAAVGGNIAIIKYCLQNECPITEEVCNSAMCNEDHKNALEALKLLRSYSCPWDWMFCYHAIISCNFVAMLWAMRNGCPWTDDTFSLLVERGSVTTIEEVLQFFLQHESSMFIQTTGTLQMDPALVEAIDKRIFQSSNDYHIIEKLKLLCKYGYKWNENIIAEAAEQGRLRVLQWLQYKKTSNR